MNKKLLLSLVFTGAMLFSGCSQKAYQPAGTYYNGKTEHGELYTVIGNFVQKDMFTSKASYLNTVIAYPLQIAAEDTLAKGYNYFAIATPKQISNVDGIMINTTGEYIDKCANNNILKGLLVLTNPCQIAIGDLNYPYAGMLKYHMFKTKPESFLAYDAKQVIEDLKAKDMYYAKPRYKGEGDWNKEGKLVFVPTSVSAE